MSELPLILALLVVHSSFVAGSMWLARIFARRGDTPQATMPVAPYFVSVTILFGLLTSFHANNLWDR